MFILLCSAVFLSVADAGASLDYYSPDNILKFADFLYEQGDYLRAASEYQRYLFYNSEDGTDGEQIRYKIAVCYRFAGQTEQAIQGFETLLQTHPKGQFASRAYYQIGATYFLTDQFEQSVQFLRGALPHIADTRQHAEAEQLIGLSYLMQKQWSEAGKVFEALQKSGTLMVSEKAKVYHNYAEAGARLPTRSPFLAGSALYNCPWSRAVLYR